MRSFFVTLVVMLVAGAGAGCGAADDGNGTQTQDPEVRFSTTKLVLSRGDSDRAHPGDAYWMARLSALAYGDQMKLDGELHEMGLVGPPGSLAASNEIAFFGNSETGTDGVFVGTATHAILVFRGTDPSLSDLATDMNRARTTTPFGLVHRGFYTAFSSIWNDGASGFRVRGNAVQGEGMRTFLLRRSSTFSSSRPLFIAGHSLGGALATLAAVHLAGEGRTVNALYTFGAPRVGDEAFATLAAKVGGSTSRTFRYTNARDPVVSLPYFGYWHPLQGGDEKACEISLRGAATGHGIAAYLANLTAQLPQDLDVQGPSSGTRARAKRYADVIFDEQPTFETNVELRPPARRVAEQFRAEGLDPVPLATIIDGTRVDIVRVATSEAGLEMDRLVLFDGSGFVVEVGFIDGIRYMHELEPRTR